ncbi:SH2 domain-containing protein 6 isoform X1 [Esox lucius]|uniref:SH2 domain-containing protein n=1 Tax=Esox lucius TaxID=8010 RepID=A0A3P8XWY2_ESOLU|nr:SH2 domain-containing protein 6 isoform X1 [Esox lucius]
MSFFGKFKNIHSGPPAPPKRIENNAGFGGWPEDEFDADDGDTYEAPPCERPVIKVPPRPVEENVYLERTPERPNPGLPKRQAAPPPRPAKMTPIGKTQQPHLRPENPEGFYIDPNTKKPPELDRREKPAKWSTSKKTVPPPLRPAPAPAPPPPPAEEDVYLDPNEGQGDGDDLYLEPTAACPPVPRSPMRIPLPPKTAAVPLHLPIKPPVPRAKSTSVLISQATTALNPDIRRSTFPGKLPPPTLGIKPPLPSSLKEPKPSPPLPPTVDITAAVSSSGVKTAMMAGKEDREWFAEDCDRKTAEDVLMRINKDGSFLIRHSSAQNARQPYTLAVLYKQKVYNIPIRFLEETRSYALGKEGKKNEEFFCSLQEIISHHKNNQLLLIDSKSQAKHTTYLTYPARP